jgi:hypothetical protein
MISSIVEFIEQLVLNLIEMPYSHAIALGLGVIFGWVFL